MERNYGWRRDLPDHRDHIAPVMLAAAALPSKIDLSPMMPKPYDQKNLGSCTANAIAGLIEYDEMKQKKLNPCTPSRLYVYYNERFMENTVKSDAGAMIRDGIKSLNLYGYCEETLWPYVTTKFATKPSKAAMADAARCKVSAYERVPQTLPALQAALATTNPVVFGFSVYDSFESDEVAHTGLVHYPQASESQLGGHAVLLCGYDNAKKMFLVRNSWGVNWGIGGYFFIDYKYVLDANLADDFWIIKMVPQVD